MLISPELAAKVERPLRRLIRRVARHPGRACVYLLIGTVTIGGALYSVTEKNADWFDGVWWATVTLTTVGYGDYSPESFLGRWLAAFVMAGGIGSVAILTGILADEIREARLEQADYTPDLSDDIDKVLDMVGTELDKLRAKVSHPEVVAVLKKLQAEIAEEIEEEEAK
jgi:voltage-gated potassium channel